MLSLSCADTLHSVLPAIPFALINSRVRGPSKPLACWRVRLPISGLKPQRQSAGFGRREAYTLSRFSSPHLLKPRPPVQPNGGGILFVRCPRTHSCWLESSVRFLHQHDGLVVGVQRARACNGVLLLQLHMHQLQQAQPRLKG